MEKITNELADKVKAWLEGQEVKAAIEATEKAAESETGTFEVIITTEQLDRYQEVIKLDGWELEHYKKNPVVLWGHDHFTLPIGVCTSIEIQDGKMIARGRFSPHEHAQNIRALYDMGVVRATSVGFIEKEREGNLITKAELLEFSFVSVPANPYALRLDTLSLTDVSNLVTKGIFKKKEVDETAPEENEEEENTETELTEKERKFAEHVASIVIAQLNADSALEVVEDQPEGTEGDDSDDADVKMFRKKQTVQKCVTALSEALAELRQADRR